MEQLEYGHQDVYHDWLRLQKRAAEIKREWEIFAKTGKVPSDHIVSAEVLSSWIRCRNRKMDPYNIPNIGLTQAQLKQRLEENDTILQVISPFLQVIRESVQGTGFKIDIHDKELYLLQHFGDQKVLDSFQVLGMGPGVSRCEADSGTNAMNLAIILEKPVQVMGAEHYNVEFHIYSCTSVPIKDESGKIVAVINTAGDYRLMHRHTLGMMIALGKSIEYSIVQRRIRQKSEIDSRINKEITESISDALVVVDTKGQIVAMNRIAQELLDVRGQNIIGCKTKMLWGRYNPFEEVMVTGKPILDQEIMLKVRGKTVRLIGTIRPVNSGETELQGLVGTFKGMDKARGMMKNFVGWKAHFTFDHLVGESVKFREVVRLARETARIQSNILIQGESGTGKELFAQAIHNASLNHEGPFVVINCAAIPSGLLESELFGYEGGAFTGAKKEGQSGKFELAYGGTIFLDEINSLPIDMQAKLLRTLQNKTVIRVGGSEEIPINLRIIAASNTDLWEMVRRGEFREDLFYRINVITISIPPLRERRDDIGPLIKHITLRLTERLGLHLEIEESALDLIKRYDWPGNVRELENVLERSYVMARARKAKVVGREDLYNYPGIKTFFMGNNSKNIQSSLIDRGYAYSLKDVEKNALVKALAANDWNITVVAQILGVARNTIYRKIKRYGIRNGNGKEYGAT